MFGFTSWSDFREKSIATLKSAAEATSDATKDLVDKSKIVANSVSENVTKFVEEQKQQYNQVEHETDLNRRKKIKKEQIMNSGHPPWYIDPIKSKNYDAEKEIIDELKLNILKLCEDENNFLYQAPSSSSVFDFKLEYALPVANEVLKQDPILPKIRFKLVPKTYVNYI